MKNVTNSKVERGDMIKGIVDIFYHCLILAQAQYNGKISFFNMNIPSLGIMKTYVSECDTRYQEKSKTERGLGLGPLN